MSAAAITRKEFLRGLMRPSTYLAKTPAPAPAPTDDPALAALESDFPPALLNEEAVRLGLDPQSMDRQALLRAVFQSMQDQRGS